MNNGQIHPKKLLNSHWTKVAPSNQEKHFTVVEVEYEVGPLSNQPHRAYEREDLHLLQNATSRNTEFKAIRCAYRPVGQRAWGDLDRGDCDRCS